MAEPESQRFDPATSARTKQWFDQLEKALHHEAELAGLLEHGSMVGSAREFLVSRVLRSILPPLVHIGSGRVVGQGGAISKQVDIVLYDSRFPVLEIQPGFGLYYMEGVLGAIEVKSTLTHDKLRDALRNCESLARITGHVTSFCDLNELAAKEMTKGLDRQEAEAAVKWRLVPHTYVFSFATEMSVKSICGVVTEHYNKHMRSRWYPELPVVIVTGGAVGLLNDGWLTVEAGEEDQEEVKAELGPGVHTVMGFWESPRPFGWFALRVIHDITERLAKKAGPCGVDFTIDAYLPMRAYHEERMSNTPAEYIYWAPGATSGPSS